MTPTHANIDGKTHLVARIEEEETCGRTHRVRFACGMLHDVRGAHEFDLHSADRKVAKDKADVEKLRVVAQEAHQAASDKRDALFEAMNAEIEDQSLRSETEQEYLDAYKSAALATETYHSARVVGDKRWIDRDGAAKGCEHCVAVETGTAEVRLPEIVKREIRLADIPLGISCPQCGTEIRMRRYGKGAACVGEGHHYTIPEVQAVAVALMTRLAKGELFPGGKK